MDNITQQRRIVVQVTGDGKSTAFTVWHNFAIPQEMLAMGYPEINMTSLPVDFPSNPDIIVVGNKANCCMFTCAPFNGGARITIYDPVERSEAENSTPPKEAKI